MKNQFVPYFLILLFSLHFLLPAQPSLDFAALAGFGFDLQESKPFFKNTAFKVFDTMQILPILHFTASQKAIQPEGNSLCLQESGIWSQSYLCSWMRCFTLLSLPSVQRLTNKETLLQNVVVFWANPSEEHPYNRITQHLCPNCICLLSGPFTITLMQFMQPFLGFRRALKLWIKIWVWLKEQPQMIPFKAWPSSPAASDTCKASIFQVIPFTWSCAFSPCFLWLEGFSHQMGIFRKPWNRKYQVAPQMLCAGKVKFHLYTGRQKRFV